MTEEEKKEIAKMVMAEIKKNSIDYRNKQIMWSNQDNITLMERSKIRIPAIDDRGVPPFYGNMDCQTLLEAYGLRKVEKLTANASGSAEQAKASEENAKQSESNAKQSEDNASSYADRASSSESNARASENNAKGSSDAAAGSAALAVKKAGEAESSASSASSSASSAAASKASAESAKNDAVAAKASAESIQSQMQQSLNNAVEEAISAISLRMHPVGSYYISDKADNPSTFLGGTWELLKDAMLIGAGNKYSAGSTGGSDTHSLTKDEMPAHNHGSAGEHTHNRGSMNITGTFFPSDTGYFFGVGVRADGAFVETHKNEATKIFQLQNREDLKYRANGFDLDASRTWTGETSNNGSHAHTTEGSSKAFSILNPYKAVYIWHRTA